MPNQLDLYELVAFLKSTDPSSFSLVLASRDIYFISDGTEVEESPEDQGGAFRDLSQHFNIEVYPETVYASKGGKALNQVRWQAIIWSPAAKAPRSSHLQPTTFFTAFEANACFK